METFRKEVDILKLGTNVLIKRDNNKAPVALNHDTFERAGCQASSKEGPSVILVSSAAIAAGMIATGQMARPKEMPELQRQASIGWRLIQNAWAEAIPTRTTGGVLLTRQELNPEDDSHLQERDEALKVIYALLKSGNVPIVNENDTISHAEITFGDNDILAALLAASLARSVLFEGQVRLFLLSDTNGVYADRHDPSTRIPVIANTDEYRHLALGSDSGLGSGGMASKFMAADIAGAAGVDMWLYDPRDGSHRYRAMIGKIGTYFPTRAGALTPGEQIDPQVIQ